MVCDVRCFNEKPILRRAISTHFDTFQQQLKISAQCNSIRSIALKFILWSDFPLVNCRLKYFSHVQIIFKNCIVQAILLKSTHWHNCARISKICSQNWLFRLAHLAVLWWSFFMVLFFENMFYHIISVRCRLNIIAGGLAFYLLYIFGIILYIFQLLAFHFPFAAPFSPFLRSKKKSLCAFFSSQHFHQTPKTACKLHHKRRNYTALHTAAIKPM